MFCPHCGAEIPDDAKVCAACGNELSQQPDQSPAPFAPKTSPLAIWSLVLGILGWFTCLPTIPGLILGIMGLKQVKEKPREFTGSGLAIAGIIVSAVGVLVSLVITSILAAILFPVFARGREQARSSVCQTNIRQLCQAALLYADDYNGKYPPAANWCDATRGFVKQSDVYKDPSAPDRPCGYGFSSALGGISEADVTAPADTVLIFESDLGWNANGGREAMITRSRHYGGFNIGYADSHVKELRGEELTQLVWSTKP